MRGESPPRMFGSLRAEGVFDHYIPANMMRETDSRLRTGLRANTIQLGSFGWARR
jgi:hypothetical protein